MNKTVLRFTWILVKAAEFLLPIIWKILVILGHILIFFAGFFLVFLIV